MITIVNEPFLDCQTCPDGDAKYTIKGDANCGYCGHEILMCDTCFKTHVAVGEALIVLEEKKELDDGGV